MLLVVFGHVFCGFSSYYGYDDSLFMICSLFTMPLFIYVTGIFAKKSRRPAKERAAHMFKIFLVMQILTSFIYYFIMHTISFNEIFSNARYTLWYLLTCACFYMSEYLLEKVNPKKILFISFLVAIFSGFIPFITDFLSIARTINLFPFFILGYFSSEFKIEEIVYKYKEIIYSGAFLIVVFFIFNPDVFIYRDIYLKYSFHEYGEIGLCFIRRLFIIPLIVIMSATILTLISKNKTVLSFIGDKTLYIYLTHGLVIKTIMYLEIYLNNPIIENIFVYLICMFIGIFCWIVGSKYKKWQRGS